MFERLGPYPWLSIAVRGDLAAKAGEGPPFAPGVSSTPGRNGFFLLGQPCTGRGSTMSDHGQSGLVTWMVIPALPGTRIEWEADWCEAGSVAVHAWLFKIDVAEYDGHVDTSCVNGYPMVWTASRELMPAHEADLDGKPGELIEP